MRILVLGGCGAMGREVVRDLVKTSEADLITIADINFASAAQLSQELKDKRLQTLSLDLNDKKSLVDAMRRSEVVANCTTYHYGVLATEAAIEARIDYLDLGGLYNTPKQLALDEKAKQAGITVVLGCGATPGITNILARRAANKLDRVEEIHIAFASYRDVAPSAGLLDTILDEFSPETDRFFYDHGKLTRVSAFAGARTVDFQQPVGRETVFYVPHSEIHTLPRFIEGLRIVDVRGTWRPEIINALKSFHHFNLLSNDPIRVHGMEIGSRSFLRAHFLQSKFIEEGEWAFLLNVEVLGTKGKQNLRIIYNTSHPSMAKWGKTATARVTGIAASIGVQLLGKKISAAKGVIAPEAYFPPDVFLSDLAKREIYFHEDELAG